MNARIARLARKARTASRPADRLAGAVACAIAALALSSCMFENWHADLGDFVERGLSLTKLVSFTYAQEGVSGGGDVAHGTPVTVSMTILNPKELDLAYELICDPTLVESDSLSAVSESGTSDGYTTASFSFIPTALAEHGDVTFGLAMRSPSINKQFQQGTIDIRCDCAPSPVGSIVAGPRSDGRACIGFSLPPGYENSDVVSARIAYSSATVGTSKSVTESVSRDGPGLTATPDPALLDATAETFPRYFIPDDVVAGNPYSFTVVLIDASGKESAPASASVAGNEVTLAFDANGGTGTVGARFGFNGSTVAIPNAATLSMEGSLFAGWNTARDGSGTTYMPGANYTFTMANQTLFAQWTKTGSIVVTVLNPSLRTLGFVRAGHPVTSAYLDMNGELTLSFATLADKYGWYRDGNPSPVSTAATYTFPVMTPGTFFVSATALIGGVLYSGNLTVTVTDQYMITILPKGQVATFTQSSFTNPANIGGSTQTFEHTLTRSYQLARYEVDYDLWSTVYDWAISRPTDRYFFFKTGLAGCVAPQPSSHPVTQVSDLDAIIWCNAYSEMTGAVPCYYTDTAHTVVARDVDELFLMDEAFSSDCVKWDANGYRLPTRGEWYFAASCGGMYAFDHVSGCEDRPATDLAASAPFANVRTDFTVPVADKIPNAWGLYNMSGNVWEYCFDRYELHDPTGARENYVCDFGVDRTTCGSSFNSIHAAGASSVGYKVNTLIRNGSVDDGFRLARSIP